MCLDLVLDDSLAVVEVSICSLTKGITLKMFWFCPNN